MRVIFPFVLCFLDVATMLLAQCDTSLVLDSQSKVNAFNSNYLNCDTLRGNLMIRGDDVVSLEALSILQVVDGNLFVQDCPFLESLQGLENISSITGSLLLARNNRLTTLRGLNRLKHLGHNLMVEGNPGLIHLRDLGRLQTLGGDITLLENVNLLGFSGMEQLRQIGGMIDLCHNISIKDFRGLDNIEEIRGNFYAYHMDSLKDFSGLGKLRVIGGEFDIGSNDALISLTGLEELQSIKDCFYIFGNPSLSSIEGLVNLTAIGGTLTIIANSSLSLCALPGICPYLANPPGSVSIWENGNPCSSQSDFQRACSATPVVTDLEYSPTQVYPNPTPGRIYTRVYFSTPVMIEVMNHHGEVVDHFIHRGDNPIDLQVNAGFYYLRFLIDHEQKLLPVVVH